MAEVANKTDNHYFEKAIYSITTVYFICIAFLSEAKNKIDKSLPFDTSNMIASIMRVLTGETFSEFHSIVDVIVLSYVMVNSQYFIGFLILCIMACNIVNLLDIWSIRHSMSVLTWYPAGLFHSTLQLLPLSLSLGYYDSSDIFINILFIIVSTSFTFIIFVQSKKINSEADNNTRINIIYALCIILDYIHIILLLLCNVYTTNRYFFWKAVLQSYPFCVGIQIAVVYHEWRQWIRRVITRHDIWNGFWFSVFLWIVVPVGSECINASWIIFLYNNIFKKLRCAAFFSVVYICIAGHRQSKQLDESLKDDLVDWLTKDKDDLLLKICCINHVKLHTQYTTIIRGVNKLLIYLEDHHRENNKFYHRVTWHGIQSRSEKLKDLNLTKRIVDDVWDYYRLDRVKNDVIQKWTDLSVHRDFYHLQKLVEVSWEAGAVSLLIGYGIFTIFNVFSSPFIAAIVMYAYDSLNIHQSCFILLYSVIMSIAIYKLYVMMNYERMMWYILPDLSQNNCTSEEIQKFKKHYQIIKYEFDETRDVLSVIVGDDVAHTIMLYVPDFIGSQDL